jgi:hypothetical protein
MQAPGSLSNNSLPAIFGGILLRYIFADGTELHLFLHELFRPDIHKLIGLAIGIHGKARVEMPRPGKLV